MEKKIKQHLVKNRKSPGKNKKTGGKIRPTPLEQKSEALYTEYKLEARGAKTKKGEHQMITTVNIDTQMRMVLEISKSDGKKQKRSKSVKGIKNTASPENIYAVALDLVNLQKHPMTDLYKVETKRIINEG